MASSSVTENILYECLEIMKKKDPSCSLVANALAELITSNAFDDSASLEKILNETKSVEVSQEASDENP